MTDKDKFLEQFKSETDMDAEKFKDEARAFMNVLNRSSRELRAAFRAAVRESTPEKPTEQDAAQGLSALFGEMD